MVITPKASTSKLTPVDLVRLVWGSFLIAAAALKTHMRNGYNVITPKTSTSNLIPVDLEQYPCAEASAE